MKVAAIGAVQIANSVSYLATLPFVALMVLHLLSDGGVDRPREEAGFYTGLLESGYHVGAFFGAIFWGRVSDVWGRRPAILGGLAGTVVSALLFGLSRTYAQAFVARFLWGALNQNIGVGEEVEEGREECM